MAKLVEALEVGFNMEKCDCSGVLSCDWCLEMSNRNPDDCEVCKSFASNCGATPLECSHDCYIHSKTNVSQ